MYTASGVKGHRYDITLLKLPYKLTMTDAVNIVCLPDQVFPVGTRCVAAGWGRDESDGIIYLV